MTNPHPRTTQQALAEQKATAERDRLAAQRRAAQQKQDDILDQFAKPSAQPQQAVIPATKQAVAVPDNRTSVHQYVDEIAPSSIVGRAIKFNKNGQFEIEDTGEGIPDNQDFIALCDETLVGWIKFYRDGVTPPERNQGLLYDDDFDMPPREKLDDLNPADWPIGLSGEPEDPWKHQMNLVLQSPGTQELYTFRTTSPTGRRAVGNLLRHYNRMQKKDGDCYPVVRLKVGGFNHRDERIGWVPTPMFAVVGKAPKASAAIPDTSPTADLNDKIPF
jgi:hypothetical protein